MIIKILYINKNMNYLKFLLKNRDHSIPLALLLIMLGYLFFSGEFKESIGGTITAGIIWGAASFVLIRDSIKMYKTQK